MGELRELLGRHAAKASGGDPLQLTRLSGISDPRRYPLVGEIGPGGYD